MKCKKCMKYGHSTDKHTTCRWCFDNKHDSYNHICVKCNQIGHGEKRHACELCDGLHMSKSHK